MKIQKQVSDKRGNKKYYKYVVVLPKKAVDIAKLKEGDELYLSEKESKKGKVVLEKR